jgi:predicted transcriptional regulator
LDNPRRAELLKAVKTSPGSSLVALSMHLRVPRNTLEHHARTLERLGYVRAVRAATGTVLFPTESAEARFAHVLARAHAKQALDIIKQEPGLSQRRVASALGMRKSHASSLLKELEGAGLVERTRRGRDVILSPTPQAGRIT